MSQHILTQLVKDAADDKPGAAAEFFSTLINSKVFVAIDPNITALQKDNAMGQGDAHLLRLGYQVVNYQGANTLPVFSEEEFIREWSEVEVSSAETEFSKLLWMLGEETWLYLNPGQEVGKEFTPWEIDLLKKGPESIPELVAALGGSIEEELTVKSGQELFPDLKTRLLPILQIYPELEEAFLVAMKDSESGAEKPTLGIRYGGITEAKRIYLRAEIENASREHLSGDQQLFLVDDLESLKSPNWRLFEGANPFYISQKPSIRQTASPGVFGRLFSWMKKLKSHSPNQM